VLEIRAREAAAGEKGDYGAAVLNADRDGAGVGAFGGAAFG
jgi:hypothetical protein